MRVIADLYRAPRKIAFSLDYGVAAKIKNAHISYVCCAFWFSCSLSSDENSNFSRHPI